MIIIKHKVNENALCLMFNVNINIPLDTIKTNAKSRLHGSINLSIIDRLVNKEKISLSIFMEKNMGYEFEIAFGCIISDYAVDSENCKSSRHKNMRSGFDCGNCKIKCDDLILDNDQIFTRINDNWIFIRKDCPYREYTETVYFMIYDGELNIKLSKSLIDNRYMKYICTIDENALLKTLPEKYKYTKDKKPRRFDVLRDFL